MKPDFEIIEKINGLNVDDDVREVLTTLVQMIVESSAKNEDSSFNEPKKAMETYKPFNTFDLYNKPYKPYNCGVNHGAK